MTCSRPDVGDTVMDLAANRVGIVTDIKPSGRTRLRSAGGFGEEWDAEDPRLLDVRRRRDPRSPAADVGRG